MTRSGLLPRMRNLALEPGYEQTIMQCAMEMLRWCALFYSLDGDRNRWNASATNLVGVRFVGACGTRIIV